MELAITVGILLLELAILGRCYVMQKRPVTPGRPRLIPYNGVMMLVMVMVLVTLAHLVGLVTGHPVVPRTSKYS
jgi:hypothetical protein